MNGTVLDQSSLRRSAQIIPVVRGLLAESTGDEDVPYKPVTLKSLTSKEAIDFAGSAKNADAKKYPAPLVKGQKSPLFLDTADFTVEPDSLRKQLNDVISAYSQQYNFKPEIVCLRKLGVLYVEREDNNAEMPLCKKVALITGAAGAIGYGVCRGLL